MELHAVVVKRGRRVHDLPTQQFELLGVVSDQVGLEARNGQLGALAAAAHLADADETIVGFDLYQGANEAPPVRAVGMPERSLQRHGHGSGSYVDDLHAHSLLWSASVAAGAPPIPNNRPPSTTRLAPVTNEARSEARNATHSATSRGCAMRPSGCIAATDRLSAAGSGSRLRAQSSIGVSTEPGATQLTRTPALAMSMAMLRVRPTRACFEVV